MYFKVYFRDILEVEQNKNLLEESILYWFPWVEMDGRRTRKDLKLVFRHQNAENCIRFMRKLKQLMKGRSMFIFGR